MAAETPQDVTERISLRMMELRIEAGLTQARVAETLGMTLTNYQRIEHGTQNVTIKTIVRVANALGARTVDLFDEPTTGRSGPGRPKG